MVSYLAFPARPPKRAVVIVTMITALHLLDRELQSLASLRLVYLTALRVSGPQGPGVQRNR